MKNLKILYLVCIVIVFSACDNFFEQVYEVEIPEHTPTLAPTLTLNSSDDVHVLFLGKTIGALEPEAEQSFVENGTVELLKNDAPFAAFEYDNLGLYLLNTENLVLEDADYRLRVSAPGFETVEAEQRPPAAVPIVAATYEEDGTIDFEGERKDEIVVEINDPEGVENIYALEVLMVDIDGNEYYFGTGSNDPIVESFYNEGVVFRDKTFNGKNYSFVVYVHNYVYNEFKTVKIKLSSWTNDKYLFERSLDANSQSDDNPFVEPTVVHSNCTSDAGLFTIVRSSLFEIEL